MNSINNFSTTNYNNYNNRPAFKANPGKKPSTFISLATRSAIGAHHIKNVYNSFIEIVMAKKVIAPVINSKWMEKLADKLGKTTKMTDHMATIGSFVTTTTYAGTTLANKKLEKKPARTLALNQILVTALSTVGAYTINDYIANFTKQMSYKFRNANINHHNLEKRMHGFGVAQKLLTFSLMYRYVAPVIVTPIASKIGKALNSKETAQPKPKMNLTLQPSKTRQAA